MRVPSRVRLPKVIQAEVRLLREQWFSLCMIFVLGFIAYAICIWGAAALDVVFSVLNMVGQVIWNSPEAGTVITLSAGYLVWRLVPDFWGPPPK